MKLFRKWLSLLIPLLFLLNACAPPSAGNEAEKAPEFRLTATDGRIIALSDLREQAIFLNFWEAT
jgi:hypothetical protein